MNCLKIGTGRKIINNIIKEFIHVNFVNNGFVFYVRNNEKGDLIEAARVTSIKFNEQINKMTGEHYTHGTQVNVCCPICKKEEVILFDEDDIIIECEHCGEEYRAELTEDNIEYDAFIN